MYQAFLKMKGKVPIHQNFRHTTIDKINSEYEHIKWKEFDDEIKCIHGYSMSITKVTY